MARILLVDDERSIRLTLRVFLENAGHSVALAEDAEQAAQMLEGEPYDVLITDIVLPGMSGVELLMTLREKDPRPQVIMLTGQPTVETASESVRAGAMHYITKPVSRPSLLRVVNQALRLASIEQERRQPGGEQSLREEPGAHGRSENGSGKDRLESGCSDAVNGASQGRLSALGQLTGSLAEEFGTVMHRLQAELQVLMKDGGLKNMAQVRLRLRAMADLVRQARQVVWKTREFCHPHDTLRIERVDLSRLLPEVVEQVWAEHGTALADRELVRVEHSAEGDCQVAADLTLLRNALSQVVLNALQAMPKGGVLEWSVLSENGQAVLTVSDLGVGMDADTVARCCDLFFTTRSDGSPGIGLTLARDSVAIHGGTVRVESKPGKGTTVTLRLPDTAPAKQPA